MLINVYSCTVPIVTSEYGGFSDAEDQLSVSSLSEGPGGCLSDPGGMEAKRALMTHRERKMLVCYRLL